jgi:DNA polymerase III epsilon subunit-like protein
MGSPGKFLFFDTETDANGRMSKPVTQTLMQLAWVVTDSEGGILVTQDRLVKGATRVGKYAPHGLTPAHVSEHGDEPSVVLEAFMKDARGVVENGGRLVAHNCDFDIGVLEHANGGVLDAMPTFCTMKDASIMAYVGVRTARGFKYPKLVELFVKLFGKEPEETLHDALGDTHVLRKSFHELLRLGVISFGRTEEPTVVDRGACDVFINASDVATLSGLMAKFNRHPYEVAEKVLSRYGRAFGVSGRGAAVVRSLTEVKVDKLLEVASEVGGGCRTTSELGKREREMHTEVDSRGDITPEIAREAKRIITSRLARSFGVTQEEKAVEHHDITDNNTRPYHLRIGTTTLVCGLVGRIDGFSDGKLVELKTRTKRLFRKMRDYEQVQMEIYMRMVQVDSAVLIESFTDDTGTTRHEHAVAPNDELWEHLVADCMRFCRNISSLVATPKLWHEWESGDVDTRKRVWDSIV